jgi:5-methyltetrahydrofolate--homocysteine methyltransferase
MTMVDLQALANAIIKGNQTESVRLTQDALDEGISPKKVLEDGLIAGMNVIGVRLPMAV